ncbi:MAG: hypothetical protein V4650_15535 [Pseudomonadota bacterium]
MMRSGVQRGCLWAALFFGLVSSAAWSHGVRNDIRVDITPIAVEGLTVELHQDAFQPQLVVSNRSGKLLEVLDAEGRSFIRIGDGKAAVDLAAKAYHLSRVAGGGNARANTLSATPRWRTIATEPAFGWFDSRIATVTLDIPYAVKQIGREMPFGQWSIPARLDGQPLEIRGVFTYTPPPLGIAVSALESTTAIAPGVLVQLVPGPVPALFLRNSGDKTVQVLDAAGKAFLKVGADGVWADLDSPSWRTASTKSLGSDRGWKQLSRARSISWLEPRAAFTGRLPQPMPDSGQLNDWQVPLLVGRERIALRGHNRWMKRAAPNAKAGPVRLPE